MDPEKRQQRIRKWLRTKGIEGPSDEYLDYIGRLVRRDLAAGWIGVVIYFAVVGYVAYRWSLAAAFPLAIAIFAMFALFVWRRHL